MAKKIISSKERNLSALVVDDDTVSRMVHVGYCTRYNFETNAVENGREAVDLVRSGRQFDVIFMDYSMPVMNGIQVSQVIIRHTHTHLRIIEVLKNTNNHQILCSL